MIERNGDLFASAATYLGHGVNCKGVMGAGIAKTFKEKYPKNYAEYRRACERGELTPGAILAYPENGKVIVNMASQNNPGADATYLALFHALYRFSHNASRPERIAKFGNTIAIPEIGCGIGGLAWLVVKDTILLVENIYPDIEYEVWHYAK